MSETKFSKSRRELDFNQAKMDIEKGDRFRIIRAIESLEIADEMYAMLEDLAQEYHCKCGHKSCRIEKTRKEIDDLLAKARGEL